MAKKATNSVKKKDSQGAAKGTNRRGSPSKGPKKGIVKGKSNGSNGAKNKKSKDASVDRLSKIDDVEQLLKMVPHAKGPFRSQLFKQIRHVKKAAKSKERRERREAEKRGETVERAIPVTIEMMRETDDTYVAGDEEVAEANEVDEFSDYFAGKTTPKLFVTTGMTPLSPKMELFLKEFTAIVPNCVYYERMKFRMKSIVESAKKRDFTDILVFIEKKKMPYGVYITHLPNGPSSFFRLSGLTLAQDIRDIDTAASTDHLPEIITKNFTTRCGERISRQFQSLFPLKAEYLGRRLIVFHNQRDFIFFRHYRYIFAEDGEKAKLQEIGPRFTLKLRILQEGTFDFKEGKHEFVWRPDSQVSRKRFFL